MQRRVRAQAGRPQRSASAGVASSNHGGCVAWSTGGRQGLRGEPGVGLAGVAAHHDGAHDAGLGIRHQRHGREGVVGIGARATVGPRADLAGHDSVGAGAA